MDKLFQDIARILKLNTVSAPNNQPRYILIKSIHNLNRSIYNLMRCWESFDGAAEV